jgi:tight adherence protein C
MSPQEIVAAATDIENLIIVLGAIGTFLTVIAVVLPFTQRDLLAPRLKVVAARREELRKVLLESEPKAAPRLSEKKKHITAMGTVLDRLNLRKQLDSHDIRMALSRAGLRGQAPMVMFLFARLFLPVVMAVAAFMILMSLASMQLPGGVRLMIILVAAGFGFYLPNILVKNLSAKRQQAVNEVFPDALDLLVICVEAGLSLEAAFTRVAADIGPQAPEFAEELGLTTAELSFLGDRGRAIDNFAKRVDTPGVRSLAVSLVQSEKYGTPLAVSLRVLAQENRDNRLMAAEKKAGALPALLTGPMIVFFLPTVFIVLLGPAIIQIIQTF